MFSYISEASELPAFYQYLDHSHINIWTWHCHMCHMSMYKILKLHQIAKDIDIDNMSIFKQLCKICIQDKSHKHVSKASWYSTSQSDKIIHMNINDREKITFFFDENNHYWINFVDDNSDWLNLKFMKIWNLILKAVQEFHDKFEQIIEEKITAFQSNNVSKFNDIIDWCKKKKIHWHSAVFYTHKQNNIAEIVNCILTEQTHVIFAEIDLSDFLWKILMNNVCYTRNWEFVDKHKIILYEITFKT